MISVVITSEKKTGTISPQKLSLMLILAIEFQFMWEKTSNFNQLLKS